MEKKKVIIVGSVVLGTVALAILAIKMINKRKAKKAVAGFMPDATPTVSEFPLKSGSRGENVKKLQTYLNTKIKAPMALLVVDGIFGTLTESALKTATGKTSITKTEFEKLIPYKTT